MATIIWTEAALSDLDEIADYIALDDPEAAKKLVRRVFSHVEKLIPHPKLGSIPPELRPIKAYRQIIEPPCRVFYRAKGQKIYIVHVMRGERAKRKRGIVGGMRARIPMHRQWVTSSGRVLRGFARGARRGRRRFCGSGAGPR